MLSFHHADHSPPLLTMDRSAHWKPEYGYLHGFGSAYFDPTLYYHWQDNRMHCGLVVVTWQLVDHGPGAGGFVCVPGSHKSNLPGPQGLYHFRDHQDLVVQETCKAGDCIVFSESLTHGTARWRAAHQRRSVLFRYSPANSAYGECRPFLFTFRGAHQAVNCYLTALPP